MAFEGPNGSMIAPNSGPGPLPPTRPLAHAASNVSVEVFVDEDARETGPGAVAAAMLATPAAPWRSLPTVAEKTKENAGKIRLRELALLKAQALCCVLRAPVFACMYVCMHAWLVH